MMKKWVSSYLFVLLLIVSPTFVLAAPLDEVKEYINEKYKGNLPSNFNDLTSIEEIEKVLDHYSTYFSQDEYDQYITTINRQLVGIGVVLQENEKGILIIETIDNGPAANAGIKPGEIITTANQETLIGKSVQEATTILSGPAGSTLTLKVLDQTGKSRTITLTRDIVRVSTVEKKLLYGNIGYIRLTSFSDDAGIHFGESIKSLKQQGAKSFIVDLRNNAGGFVKTAQDIVGYFPNSPNTYHLHYKTNDEIGISTTQSLSLGLNTKLLINGYSASASEMVAVAVKDQKSATIYGQTSFGKGTMQSYLPISNGDWLKLTVAEFTGPNGTIVNKMGVTPDIVTEKGVELAESHYDTLKSKLDTYKKITTLSNVALDKTFAVTFSTPMSSSVAENAIELVELGGDSIPLTIKKMDPKRYAVTPASLLKENQKYLLIIHPEVQDYRKMQLTQGAYLEVNTFQ